MLATRLKAALNLNVVDTAWNLAFAAFNGGAYGRFSVAAQDQGPQDVFFKPDGTKMYILGGNSDIVIEYDLSTAWDISTASFIREVSVIAQESQPQSLFLKPDGTKMYIIGQNGDDVNEYDLTTAWNISTASYLQNFSVAAQETNPQGIFFKPDGLKMYVVGFAGDDVNEYNLSTAWDISTASYLQNFSVAAQALNPSGVFFNPDGTKMYIITSQGDAVYEYDLSTAWNVTSASYLQNFSVLTQETNPTGVFFKPDGTKMYIIGTASDAVYEYDLSTAWDVTSASLLVPEEDYFSVAAQEANPTDLFFKPDGTKMYVIGSSSAAVYEYNLLTPWAISTAVYLQNFSVSSRETTPTGVFFKPDGTKMYVIGVAGDDVNEYNLSTAWDITTAVYLQIFSVAAQEATPSGLFFKPDGTKMYITGTSGDDVNEYDLSTAWDISTASYLRIFSVAAQDTNPTGLFFKPDGLKMYVIGATGDDVNQYNLSTAWDISTASYLQNFSVASQEAALPTDLFFKPDGLKMYVVGSTGDAVFAYDL